MKKFLHQFQMSVSGIFSTSENNNHRYMKKVTSSNSGNYQTIGSENLVNERSLIKGKNFLLSFLMVLVSTLIVTSANAQLWQQQFTTSQTILSGSGTTTSLSPYFSTTPTSVQFNYAGSTSSGATLATASNSLNFNVTSTGAGDIVVRSTNLGSSPTTMMAQFTLAITEGGTGSNNGPCFIIGHGFTNTTSAQTVTTVAAGINWMWKNSGYFYLNQYGSTTSTTQNTYATINYLLVINNSVSSQSYIGLNGASTTLTNGFYDIWQGTTKIATYALNNNVALDQFSFGVPAISSAGKGTLGFTNVLLDPIPPTPTANAATGATSGTGFTANWSTVSGVTGYNIDYSQSSTFASGVTTSYVTGASSNSLLINVTAGTWYYRVRGVSQYTAGTFQSGNTSTITATSAASSGAASPSLTAAASQTVDNDFAITFTHDATWESAITGITVDGTSYTNTSYTVGSGTLTLNHTNITQLHTPGSHTVNVSATGYLTASVTQTNLVGAAAKLAIAAISSPQTAGTSFSVTVNSQDQYGNTANVSSDKLVTLATTGTGTLSGNTGTITSGSSSVVISAVSYTKAEAVTFTASAPSLTNSAASNAVTFNAGVATKLSINTISSPQTVATSFSVTVVAQDANGNTTNVTTATAISLAAAGAGTISGNTATILINTSSITLASVKYTKAETTTLTASRTSGMTLTTSAASNSVLFNPGVATKLAISTIASQTAGTGFSVTVNSVDANGNAANVTSSTLITLTKNAGSTGSFGGTLTGTITNGTNTVTISGVTYSGATVNVACNATASGGMTLTAAVSNSFTVVAGALSKLTISSIGSQSAYTPFTVTVNSTDAFGNQVVVPSDNPITLTKATGTGTLGGTLTGTILAGTSSIAISGVTYDVQETLVSITATSSGTPVLTAATSNTFTVGAATPIKLGITSIATQVRNIPFSITVTALDLGNNPQVVTSDNLITLTLATGTGSFGGTLTGTILNGASSVIFTGITYSVAEAGVSVTATQTSGTPVLTAATSATFTVNPITFYSPTSGTINWTDASWGVTAGGPFNQSLTTGSDNVIIQNGSTVNLNTNYTSTTGTITITGTLNIGANYKLTAGNNLTVSASTGILNIANTVSSISTNPGTTNGILEVTSGTFTLNGAMNVSGYFKNSDATAMVNTGTLAFANYSVCELNNIAISAAPTATWASNSNLLISAIAGTNNLLAINTHYGNFNFNFPLAGTGHILTSAASGTLYIDGNFTLINSHATSGKCKLINGASGDNITVHIGGDLTIPASTAGQLQGSNNASYTALHIEVGGNLSAGSGWIGSGSAITTIDFQGTGKTINASYTFGGFTTITVSGNYTLGAAFSPSSSTGAFNVTGTLNLGAFALTGNASATFTVAAAGTLETTAPLGFTTANIATYGTRTFTSGANFVLDGSAAQVVGALVTNPINSLTINNSAGVTLSAATSVTSTLALSSGILTTTATNLLTLGTAASISGASGTHYISGPVTWSLPSVGSPTIYSFPVGSATAYLPVDLTVTTSAAGSSVKVQATSATTGTVDATLSSISNTEYWTLTTTGTVLTSVKASLGKASLLNPLSVSYFAIGKNTTSAASVYTSIAGNTGVTVGGINGIGLSNAVTATPGTAGTFYLVLGIPAPAALTTAAGATVDNPFTVTYPTNDLWESKITSITINGTTLTAGYDISTSGQITFTPSASSPTNLLQVSGTKTIVVIATGYSNSSVSQSIGFGADNKLGITTQPTDPSINSGTLAIQPIVVVQDQYGNTTASTASIVATEGAGSWTIGGTTTNSAVAGSATFTDLTASSALAVTGATIHFTSTGLTAITSTGFNIPAIASVLSAGSITGFGSLTVYQTLQHSFTLTGTYLDGTDVTVTAPSGFMVSTTSGSGFASSLTISGYGTSISQVIYVLFQPTAVQSYNANLTYDGGGVTSQNLALTGSGIALTAPASVSITHTSDNIQRLSWTAPTGAYDKVLVFAKASTGTYSPTGAGSSYTGANADITLSTTYSGYSLVYAGTATNVEVTGLSNNAHYYYQILSYSGSAYSSAITTNGIAAVQPVTALTATSPATQSVLAWTNPIYNTTQSNYWDEVMAIASTGAITAPTGNGSSYTANAVYATTGTSDGNGGYVVYKGTGTGVTVTGLTNFTTYNIGVYVRHGSDWSAVTSITATPVNYGSNDFGSIATASYSGTTTWGKWNGTAFASTTSIPTATDNVWIVGGYTVTVPTGTNVCKNLHVLNGRLTAGNITKTPIFLNVYGTQIDVNTGGTLGTNTGTTGGDAAEELGINVFTTGTNPTFSITGNGGIINIDRIINTIAGSTVVIDHDVILNYHGSGNGGNAAGYHSSASGSNTLTINSGATLTFAPWSCYLINGSSSTVPTTSQTINVNGTMSFTAGIPTGNTTSPSWSKHVNSYMSMAIHTGTGTLNIGSTGVLNTTQFYPNGNSQAATTTDIITITNNGIININDTADFSKVSPYQTITGTGTTNINGGQLIIGHASGITTSGTNGPIQTSTRNYSSSARYSYQGSAAQNTGNGLPSSVLGLTVNNSLGLTLNGSVAVVDTLGLTSGIITSTSSNLLTLGSSAVIVGGNTSSYIAGPMEHTISSTGLTAKTFPIGKGGYYSPVVLNITQNASSSTTYSAEAFVGGTTPSYTLPGTLSAVSSNRYYHLASSSSNISSGTIKLVYDAQDAVNGTISIATPSNLRIAGSGSSWLDLGPLTGGSTGTITSSNLTDLGDFVLANSLALTVPPTLTAVSGATVDASIDIAINTVDPVWFSNITAVKYGTTTLVQGTDYTITSSALTLIPSGSATSGLRTTSTKTVSIVSTGYDDATVSQSIAAGTPTNLTIKTAPVASVTNGAAFSTQPAIYIKDQYGNTTTSVDNVTATASAGWTLGGTNTVAASNGTVTFSGLTSTSAAAVTGATITFTYSVGLVTFSVTSAAFNISGPNSYYWVGGTGSANSFMDQSNWSSLSAGGSAVGASGSNVAFSTTDILIFDGSDVSASAGTQTGTIVVPNFGSGTYSFGKLVLQNNAIVTWTSSSSRTISINGGPGDDFSIAAGSSLTVGTGNSSAFTISLLTGTTASISGTVILGDNGNSTHNVNAVDASSIKIKSGGIVTYNGSSSQKPFGTGTASSVVFESGSTLKGTKGGDIFGGNAVVVFQSGSTYEYLGASNTYVPFALGSAAQTFSNFVFKNTAALSGISMVANVTVDNLTLSSSATAATVININTFTLNIKGNLSNQNASNLFTIYNNTSGTGTINMNGSSLQTISYNAGGLTIGTNTSGKTTNFNISNTSGGVVLSNNLTILGGSLGLISGNFTIGSNTLIVGNITGAANLIGSTTSNITLTGTTASALGFSSGNVLGSLTLSGGTGCTATLGSDLGIATLLSLSGTGSKLDINGHKLTIKSNATGTAEVGQVKGTIVDGSLTATNITVERYIPKGMRNYRDLAPSVANAGSVFANWQENGAGSPSATYGVYITGKTGTPGYAAFDASSGFDLTTNGNTTPSLYSCVSGTWAPIIVATGGTKGFNLDPFQGLRILVRGARNFNMGTNPSSMPTATTLRATGSLVTGTVTFNAIGSGGTVSTGGYTSSYGLTPSSSYVSGEGWSFVANPYACPVSWALIIANAGTNVGNFYCFLDPTYQNGGLQRYVTVQDNNGTITVTNRPSGITSDAACLNIQPGQGFWVYATATTPKLVIQETNKVVGGTQTTVFGTSKANMLNVSIWKDINGETTNMDEAIVSFNNNYTKSFGTEDVKKLMNGGENISITESNTDLSIDGIALPSEGDEIALKLGNVTANTAYQLKVDATQFAAPGVQAFIKDAYLNTILPAEKVINFTATTDAVTYKDRFSIVFKSAKVVPVTTMKGNISVCPNPVTEKTFVVEMSNIAAGKYNVVLVNNLGQEVMNTSINHVEGSTIESIKMNKSLTGLYTVVLRSSDGKVKYTTELLAK